MFKIIFGAKLVFFLGKRQRSIEKILLGSHIFTILKTYFSFSLYLCKVEMTKTQ